MINFLINADVSILTIALLSFKDCRSISVVVCFCSAELIVRRGGFFFSALRYKVKLKEAGLSESPMLTIKARFNLRMCVLLVLALTFSFPAPIVCFFTTLWLWPSVKRGGERTIWVTVWSFEGLYCYFKCDFCHSCSNQWINYWFDSIRDYDHVCSSWIQSVWILERLPPAGESGESDSCWACRHILLQTPVRASLLYCIYPETAVYFTSHRSNLVKICTHMEETNGNGDQARKSRWFFAREDWVLLCTVQYLWFLLYLNVSSGCRA